MEEITIKLSGKQIEEILIDFLKKRYVFDNFKVSHIQVDDKRENEWENNYVINYIEFEVPLTDLKINVEKVDGSLPDIHNTDTLE